MQQFWNLKIKEKHDLLLELHECVVYCSYAAQYIMLIQLLKKKNCF